MALVRRSIAACSNDDIETMTNCAEQALLAIAGENSTTDASGYCEEVENFYSCYQDCLCEDATAAQAVTTASEQYANTCSDLTAPVCDATDTTTDEAHRLGLGLVILV